MEYSSSEDDELIEDITDLDDDIVALEVEQPGGDFLEHAEISVASDGNVLLEADGDAQCQEPFLGMEFESDTAARNFYNSYALRLGFGIRVARSRSERRKGVEVFVMKRFVCLKEGHHKKKVSADGHHKKKRKRLSIRDGCPAMMEVVRREPERWLVTKLVLEHTHVVVSPDKVREIQLGQFSGKAREHDNYLREMRQKAFGEGDAQGLLEYFKRMQAVNSGFFYAMQVDCRNCMTNVFWADSRARTAFNYFGDVVTFDTSCKKNKLMMPFATFTGINHHGQQVIFGCALIIDRTESSFTWLFETWLSAMFGRHPISLTTDQDRAIVAAAAKVFPNISHRLCRWRILSRCKKKLSDLCSRCPAFYDDLKTCINGSDTQETFENCWQSLIHRYDLRENTWMQSLYNVRDKWVPAYLKGSFFAELSPSHRLETVNKFFRKHFTTKTSLQAFLAKYDQAMDGHYEKEVQEDFATLHSERILKTNTLLEKQAADTYTRTVFEKFQVELTEALDHFAVERLDGTIIRYFVQRHGDARSFHIVDFNGSGKKPICTCGKFESSGILCRHVLGVLLVARLSYLPEQYILKRWTRKAKSGHVLDEQGIEIRNYCQNSPVLRYNDLFCDALKCAEKGAASTETYKVAKDMLRKAFADIVTMRESIPKHKQRHAEKI